MTANFIVDIMYPNYYDLSDDDKGRIGPEVEYIIKNTSVIMDDYMRIISNDDSIKNISKKDIFSNIVKNGRCNEIATKLFGNILAIPYWLNLEDNISEIDRIMYDEKLTLESAVERVWANNMVDALYSNPDNLTNDERIALEEDRKFIFEHVRNIEKVSAEKYTTASNSGYQISDKDLLKIAVHDCKVNSMFNELYPGYDSFSVTEKYWVSDVRKIISENLPQIQELKYRYEQTGMQSLEALNCAVNYTKADLMFKKLHPDFDTLSSVEQINLSVERDIIFDNVEKISGLVKENYISAGSQKISDVEALRNAVDTVSSGNAPKTL